MKLLSKCPKKVRKAVHVSATGLHCLYWGHSTLESFFTPMTTVYGTLFVVTLLAHYLNVEHNT